MTSTAFDLISLSRPATRRCARRCKIHTQAATASPSAAMGIQITSTAHHSDDACLTGCGRATVVLGSLSTMSTGSSSAGTVALAGVFETFDGGAFVAAGLDDSTFLWA